MAHYEIDSFVNKFKNLWHCGVKATLKVESDNGDAVVSLQASLGNILPPFCFNSSNDPTSQQCRYRGPSYQRRQQRRRAAREATVEESDALLQVADDDTAGQVVDENESDNLGHEAELAAEASVDPQVMAISKEAEEASKHLAKRKTDTTEADQALSEYSCEMCDFVSNWKNGLRIHVSRKHGNIEQLDGHNDDSSSDGKYFNTLKLLGKGKAGYRVPELS